VAVVAGVVAIVVVDVDGDFIYIVVGDVVVDVDGDFIYIVVGDVVVVYFWISAYSVFSFSTVTVAPPSDRADLSRSA